jgi:uncharacterized protein (DUF2461 family)
MQYTCKHQTGVRGISVDPYQCSACVAEYQPSSAELVLIRRHFGDLGTRTVGRMFL